MTKFLFFIWGAIGLICNLFALLGMVSAGSVGVGTSAFHSALALVWIGGMVFFAGAHLLSVKAPSISSTDDVLARVRV